VRAVPARRLRAVPLLPAGVEGPAPPLRLIPALSPAGRIARAEGLAGGDAAEHELRLPGIGGRYLAGIAAHVRGQGWAPAETSALLQALEHRAAMWVVCPSAAALQRAGLIEGRRGLRTPCARWTTGRWGRVALDARALAAVAEAGHGRGVCVAAVSGRGAPDRVVRAVTAPGVRSGTLAAGLAASLGVPWTVELLVAPALPVGSLMALRERVAAAPRCAWCGVPMLGPECRRCLPGAVR
jgi:hypothetical protein